MRLPSYRNDCLDDGHRQTSWRRNQARLMLLLVSRKEKRPCRDGRERRETCANPADVRSGGHDSGHACPPITVRYPGVRVAG